MEDFRHIAAALSLPVGIILLGFFVRRAGWFRAEADASLTTLTIRLLYPCFIMGHLTGHESLEEPDNLFWAPIAGFLAVMVGFGLSALVARLLNISGREAKGFTFATGIFNYGFFAFPVGEALFGEGFVGKLIVFNLGVEIAIWTVGVMILVGGPPSWRRLVNPPALAIAVALAMTAVGGREALPPFIFNVIDALAACAIPLGLLLIGGSISELLRERRRDAGLRVELGAVFTRSALIPAVFVVVVGLNLFPPNLEWLGEALVVQAAMPAGIFAIVVVKSYEGDAGTALRAILATLVGCLVTMPAWLALGLSLLSGE